MANAGYLVALMVTVTVLAMLLLAAHRAASRIKKRRENIPAVATVRFGAEEEPDLPFDEETSSDASPEERLVREILGEPHQERERSN